MTSVPPQPSATSREEQRKEIQRAQQLQMQQLNQLSLVQPVPGHTEEDSSSSITAPSSMLLSPDANQALQMLLQPMQTMCLPTKSKLGSLNDQPATTDKSSGNLANRSVYVAHVHAGRMVDCVM